MSDKPLVQQALASELADLLLIISTASSSLHFLRGFWEATVREWNGIDRLRYVLHSHTQQHRHSDAHFRIDKYYMLIRRFVNASFRLLSRNRWDPSLCQDYNGILTRKGGPLWYVRFCPSSQTQFKLASLQSCRYSCSCWSFIPP